MTILSHHAHIFIGDPKHSKQKVFDFFEHEGIDLSAEKYFLQETNVFTIEDARELKRFVSEKTGEENRVYVLIFTENFSHPAQHALLKTLEEPNKKICICFVAPREHTLLATLKSRVHTHYLQKSEIPSPIDVGIFLKSNKAKRLTLVDNFLKKIKEEDDENLRREAGLFLDAYESALHKTKKLAEFQKQFDAIFFAKEYIHDQGSSAKQLLEYVALS